MLSTLGGVGMWSIVVVLPAVQADFGVDRADASLPYTLTMVGFVFGGTLMGWLADRFGIVLPVVVGALSLSLGYVLASRADTLLEFALIHGVLIGFLGSSATFGPVIAGISLWFDRRLPLVLALRRPPPLQPAVEASPGGFTGETRPLGMRPNLLQGMLILAGISCCVAMAMPQVHIVALCADLGYGAQRGAEMLSLMLGFGIISRLASGWIADRIGPLPTLLLGSVLQAVSLLLYMTSQSVGSLYVVSALFGLFQGGIVLSYALIVRQFFPAAQAGTRIGLVLSATLGGMAIGGWMSGAIYDLTLSYDAAFLNGFFWNLLNIAIALFLLLRGGPWRRAATAAA